MVIAGVTIAILHSKHKEGKLKCPQNPFPNVRNRLCNMRTRLHNVRNPFRNVRNPFRNVRNPFRNIRNPFRNVRQNQIRQTNNVTSDTVAVNNNANITLPTIETPSTTAPVSFTDSHNGQSTEDETTMAQKPLPPLNPMSSPPPPYTPALYPPIPTMVQYSDTHETDKEKQDIGFHTKEPPPYDETWAAYPPPI